MSNPKLAAAVMDLVHEALRDKNTKRGYGLACKALLTIGLDGDEMGRVLYALSYADANGQPYRWIFEKAKR